MSVQLCRTAVDGHSPESLPTDVQLSNLVQPPSKEINKGRSCRGSVGTWCRTLGVLDGSCFSEACVVVRGGQHRFSWSDGSDGSDGRRSSAPTARTLLADVWAALGVAVFRTDADLKANPLNGNAA